MSRSSSLSEPYPHVGHEDQQIGMAPVGDPQTTRYSTSPGGHTVTPRALFTTQEGRSSFATAHTSISTEGTNTTVPRPREPGSGYEEGYVSPSPRRDGRPLIPSDPPSRSASRTGGSESQLDPTLRSPMVEYSHYPILRSDQNCDDPTRIGPSQTSRVTPPSVSTESSVTPSIKFDRLTGIIPEEHILTLRRVVSHHSLQRQKLATAGSHINNLREEIQALRTSAESLTGRINRVLSDMVQVILEGDDIISSLSKAFDKPLEQAGLSTAGLNRNERLRQNQSSNPPFDNNQGGNVSTNGSPSGTPPDGPQSTLNLITNPGGTDICIKTQGEEVRPTSSHTPSPQMQVLFNKELPPRRESETDNQYNSRYRAHLHRINNTQQSWARNGYDVPPHLSNNSASDQMPEHHSDRVLPGQPGYIPGRMHPDAPQHAQYWAQAYSARQGPQVQFDSASRLYQHEPEAEMSLLAATPYPLGPTGISAYQVTHTPPNN